MRICRFLGISAFLFLVGCGVVYSRHMGGTLRRLENREYEGALAGLEKPDGRANKLLYRLEKGLILHYHGQYDASNQEFEKAEQLIDELYTRSVSREVASLLTTDAIRAYRGEEFEQVLIHYYRAMNYQYLNDLSGALVESRKANLKLADYAQHAEFESTYKNDAFMQYLTGLFYEAEEEWNDAYIAYRNAEKGYQAYREAFGMHAPQTLGQDLARLSRKLGYEDHLEHYKNHYRVKREELEGGLQSQVIVFVESGFIARKEQQEINLPILQNDDTGAIWVLSDRLVYRYRHPYAYQRHSVKYWLRVALPGYQEVPSRVRRVRLSGGGQSAEGVLVQDLNAIALRTFEDKKNTILLRTAARALAKYAAVQGVEKAFKDDDADRSERLVKQGLGKLLGSLVNLFGAATESADTRSWLALPARIHMARLALPPGTADLIVEFLDERGLPLDRQVISGVQIERGKPVFLNYRGYR